MINNIFQLNGSYLILISTYYGFDIEIIRSSLNFKTMKVSWKIISFNDQVLSKVSLK